jgi:microcystin-dependent protein
MAEKRMSELEQATELLPEDVLLLLQDGETKQLLAGLLQPTLQQVLDAQAAQAAAVAAQGAAELAQSGAEGAETVAVAAQAAAETAQSGAEGAETAAVAAQAAAETAQSGAEGAETVAVAAQAAAETAQSAAEGAETAAVAAQSAAETAQSGAEGAETAAVAAQAAAETARDETLAALASIEEGVPVGSFLDWPLPTPPEGYLRATGAEVSRTTYAELFAVVGERHGAGDGSTTFNLPDRRGLVPRGWDDGAGRDLGARSCPGPGFAASSPGDYQADAVKSHTHELQQTASDQWSAGSAKADVGRAGTGSGHETLASGGPENLVKNVSTNWCIKYKQFP